MKFLVVGGGSIGTRHIRNLLEMGYRDITVFDVNRNSRDRISAETGIYTTDSYNESMIGADIVMICTPADTHIPYALKALRCNKSVFIEKPLSLSLQGIKELRKIAGNRVMVGFNVRFHPFIKKINKYIEGIGKIYSVHMEYAYYLPHARKNNYKEGYAGRKELGGGVVFDHLHEIDYGISLFGDIYSVFGTAERISSLDIDTEDTADLVLRYKKGFNCTLHLDYLQRNYSRTIKIIAENGIIEGDFSTGILTYIRYGKKTSITRCNKGFDGTYKEEIRHFIKSQKSKTMPIIDIEEAIHSLKVALAIKRSIKNKKVCVV